MAEAHEPPLSDIRRSPRRRLFIVLALLAPVALVILLEGILRLVGYGGYPPTVERVGAREGATWYVTNRAAPRSYFADTLTEAGSMHETVLVMPKPDDTVRVVLAGASAIRGMPQPAGLSAAAFLAAMLDDVWPDKRVEVVNLGTTAVASFPVVDMLGEVLPYGADLVVVYAGHNEFFGAGGVASQHLGGHSAASLRWRRRIGGLRIVQLGRRSGANPPAKEGGVLMERVAACGRIPHDSPLRAQAAENLAAHLVDAIAQCRARDIPVVLCTLACNERDLTPIGPNPAEPDAQTLRAITDLIPTDPSAAQAKIEELLTAHPTHALLHYRMGQAAWRNSDFEQAAVHFRRAVDLDTMPWRAPTSTNNAIREVARLHGALLCDAQATFRRLSPENVCGWELFDDHVHFSLAGQAVLARTIVETLSEANLAPEVTPEAFAALPIPDVYVKRLGANLFTAYQAAHTMCALFEVPFMKASNPDALARARAVRDGLRQRMPPELHPLVAQWEQPAPPNVPKPPLCGMAARWLMDRNQLAEAERMLTVSRRSVPPFSSWCFEDTYLLLQCRRELYGALDAADLDLARETTTRIELLRQARTVPEADAASLLGQLYHLQKEYVTALPHLEQAHGQARGAELLRVDKSLIECLVSLGQLEKAHRLAQEGVARGGPFAAGYEMMEAAVPAD